MNYQTFRTRVNHNTKVLSEALDTNQPIITILPKLYTWTTTPEDNLHSSILMRKAHDLLPAAYLGLLVNVEATGIDAFKMTNKNEIIPYELKTSEIGSKAIWRGVRGGFYTGTNVRSTTKVAVSSYLSAAYNFHTKENHNVKRIKTVLLTSDTDGYDGYFDAWELDGNIIIDKYVKKRTGTVTVKLSSFMIHGSRAKTTVPLEGYKKWKTRVFKNAPTKLKGQM